MSFSNSRKLTCDLSKYFVSFAIIKASYFERRTGDTTKKNALLTVPHGWCGKQLKYF